MLAYIAYLIIASSNNLLLDDSRQPIRVRTTASLSHKDDTQYFQTVSLTGEKWNTSSMLKANLV